MSRFEELLDKIDLKQKYYKVKISIDKINNDLVFEGLNKTSFRSDIWKLRINKENFQRFLKIAHEYSDLLIVSDKVLEFFGYKEKRRDIIDNDYILDISFAGPEISISKRLYSTNFDLNSNDPYIIFDIKPKDTLKIIKKKYRLLALKYHPDRGGDESKMKKINIAYKQLKKEIKK